VIVLNPIVMPVIILLLIFLFILALSWLLDKFIEKGKKKHEDCKHKKKTLLALYGSNPIDIRKYYHGDSYWECVDCHKVLFKPYNYGEFLVTDYLPDKYSSRQAILDIKDIIESDIHNFYTNFRLGKTNPRIYTKKEIECDYKKMIKKYERSIEWYMQFVGDWDPNEVIFVKHGECIKCVKCGKLFDKNKCPYCGTTPPFMIN
jgi:hypothetical protein